jgi:hypothetical protein
MNPIDAQPDAAEPSTTKPGPMKPDAAKPDDAKPDPMKPSLSETNLPKDGQHNMQNLGTVMIALLSLNVVGIAVTKFAVGFSQWYWLGMVIITALACAFIVRSRAKQSELNMATMMKHEVLFWLAILAAVNLVFFMNQVDRLDASNTGLVILLLLALATFLAGLRLGWQLCLLGGLLSFALVIAAYLAQFLWIVLLGGLIAVATLFYRARLRNAS